MRTGMAAAAIGALAMASAAAPATAQDLREICGDRPGLGTSPCTVDAGHLQIEMGLGDWTRDRTADSVTDTVLAADTVARIGVGEQTEVRVGWTAYGHERERDRATGSVERVGGIGDVTLGLKQNFLNPDGDRLSIAALPFVTLPAGRRQIGATTWGAGLLVPFDYDLVDGIQLQLTPEIDAEPDQDSKGRHLAYSNVIGIDFSFADKFDIDVEFQALRDRDPSGHQTQMFAAAAFDYEPDKRTQLDIGAVAGLNRNSPDIELYAGISRKF